MIEQSPQKNLVLISARQFASRLATAMLIGDEQGRLVYFNEAAEGILGRTLAQVGEMPAQEWRRLFDPRRIDGSPMPVEEMPAAIAFLERKPAFGSMRIRGLDGIERLISVTGFPLFSSPEELVGFVAIFWEESGINGQMYAKIWGCRGSLASPGPDTVRYGGNTSSVEVRLSDGSLILLDAGTGIRSLGEAVALQSPQKIHLLLTHLHLDHLEGLPFFGPLWSRDAEVEIWGPSSPIHSLEDNIARYMSPPLFPIPLFDVPARCRFHSVSYNEWSIGEATITAHPVEHPGPTVGFRIEEGGKTLVYIPDHEPAASGDLGTVAEEWVSGHALALGADVLLHDAQYTREEYETKVGWGHSSIDATVTFAAACKAERLVLFHHDPGRSDGEVDNLVSLAADLAKGRIAPPAAAYEHMEIMFD